MCSTGSKTIKPEKGRSSAGGLASTTTFFAQAIHLRYSLVASCTASRTLLFCTIISPPLISLIRFPLLTRFSWFANQVGYNYWFYKAKNDSVVVIQWLRLLHLKPSSTIKSNCPINYGMKEGHLLLSSLLIPCIVQDADATQGLDLLCKLETKGDQVTALTNSTLNGHEWLAKMDIHSTNPPCCKPLKTLDLFPTKSTGLKDECTTSKSRSASPSWGEQTNLPRSLTGRMELCLALYRTPFPLHVEENLVVWLSSQSVRQSACIIIFSLYIGGLLSQGFSFFTAPVLLLLILFLFSCLSLACKSCQACNSTRLTCRYQAFNGSDQSRKTINTTPFILP